MKKIIVIGSSNIDITACVKSMPKPGETVGGARLIQANGGKGANQAVTAARLGGTVLFSTCVGNDSNGKMLKDLFAAEGMDVSFVKLSDDNPTGTALIFVDENAENCIAVAPGANGDLRPEDMDALEPEIASAGYILIQLEIPIETVTRAIDIAYRHGVKAILNPAPVCDLPDSLISKLYLITPNETEAERLSGVQVESVDDARKAADSLMAKGVSNVIITLGSTGSLICTPEGKTLIGARKVDAVDTTAAGDVYNGALVTALAEGKSLGEAARFATYSASISVTRHGAQTSIPARAEVDAIMQ